MPSEPCRVAIYDRSTIGGLHSEGGTLLREALRYLGPIIENTPSHYIDNVAVEMKLLVVNGKLIPFTVNSKPATCYLVSVTAIIVSYLKKVLRVGKGEGWRSLFGPLADGVGVLLRFAEVEKVVFLNDWLMTTNPTVRLSSDEMREITECLAVEYPSHSLILKSVASPSTLAPDARWSLTDYGLFPYKSNFHIAPTSKKTRANAGDLALLRKTKYELQELETAEEEDLDRLVALYEDLYAKYTETHPRFNRGWFRLAVNSGFFRCVTIKDGATIIGFSLQLVGQDELISSYIGYDLSLPLKAGVYRLLMLSGFLKAREEGLVFNMSGSGRWDGVSTFKRQRGGVLQQQYGAHYSAHLSLPKRLIHTFAFRNLYRS